MEWETYATTSGAIRVNIGEQSYLLLDRLGNPPVDTSGNLPGDVLDPRQLGGVLAGSYGPEVRAWAEAHQAHGLAPRFSWRGIANELGDHVSVGLPWRAGKPRDFGLAE